MKSGEWAVEHLGGKGKVIILQGAPGVASDDRRDGFLSIVEKHPDIEVVLGPFTDFDRSKAFDAAQNMLAVHDDVDLIYGGVHRGRARRRPGRETARQSPTRSPPWGSGAPATRSPP